MPEKYCKPCQELGHLCRAVTDVDDEPLCAFCQDGEECPVSKREKEVAARFGKAAAGRAAAAVAPAKVKVARAPKEVIGENTMAKKCKCGCGAEVSDKREYKWGHTPKGAAKPKSGATPPRKTVAKTYAASVPTATSVTVQITADGLDAWWAALSLEQKAGAFSFSMCGAG
jgi:hypothetical protein